MGDQELFTELKNLAPLPRYDGSKLATMHAISRIMLILYRKIALKNRLFLTFLETPLPVLMLESQFSGYY